MVVDAGAKAAILKEAIEPSPTTCRMVERCSHQKGGNEWLNS
jgi:hypothetical protein